MGLISQAMGKTRGKTRTRHFSAYGFSISLKVVPSACHKLETGPGPSFLHSPSSPSMMVKTHHLCRSGKADSHQGETPDLALTVVGSDWRQQGMVCEARAIGTDVLNGLTVTLR